MSESGEKKELDGFARSIAALFSGASEPEPTAAAVAPEAEIDPFVDFEEGAASPEVGDVSSEPETSVDAPGPDEPEEVETSLDALAPDEPGEVEMSLDALAPDEPEEVEMSLDALAPDEPEEVEMSLDALAPDEPEEVEMSLDALAPDEPEEAVMSLDALAPDEPEEAVMSLDALAPDEPEEAVMSLDALAPDEPEEAVMSLDALAPDEPEEAVMSLDALAPDEPEEAVMSLDALAPDEPEEAVMSLDDLAPDEPEEAVMSLDALAPDEPEEAVMSLDDLAPDEPEEAVISLDDLAPDEPEEAVISLDDLAPDAGDEVARTDVMWEEVVEEEPGDEPAPLDADPDALSAALDAFLASPRLEREGQAREIREMVGALRAANALDPLADAVERLVIEASDDEASLALADLMVTAGVASRIAARLGLEREGQRREHLLAVCKAIGLEMAVAISEALSDTNDRFARRSFMDAMVMLGSTGMVVVEQMVDDNRWFVVRNAVAILGEVGGDRAIELITSTLAHTDGRVRREALLALAKVGGEEAGLLVYGMLEDPDPDARLAAAMAVGELKVERALKPLLGILEAEADESVTVAILQALGKLGDPGAVNAIAKHATVSFFSKSPLDVRIAAYRALYNIGTPHAKRLVNQAVDDKNLEVKKAVRDMVGMN